MARYIFSSPMPFMTAYSITGKDAVSPWFPLPETMTTGNSQPLIRASDPAAARARNRAFQSFPAWAISSFPIMAP